MQTGRSHAVAYTQELATHAAVHPPSTGSATPVMYEASSLNKKDTYTQCTHVLGQPSAQCMRGLDAALH